MFLKTIDDFNDLILTNIISMFIVLRNCHEIIDFFFLMDYELIIYLIWETLCSQYFYNKF